MGKMTLPPAFLKRAKAVQAAHRHLSKAHPDWASMSQQDRFKAVHAHVDQHGLRGVLQRHYGAKGAC